MMVISDKRKIKTYRSFQDPVIHVNVTVRHPVIVRNFDNLSHLSANPAAFLFREALQRRNVIRQFLCLGRHEFLHAHQTFIVLLRVFIVGEQPATVFPLRNENI